MSLTNKNKTILFIFLNLFLTFCLNNSFAQSKALPNFTQIIEKNSPAVVNISTVRTEKANGSLFGLPPGLEGTPHGELFRRFFEDQIQPDKRESISLGSGTLVTNDGYVVTNNHVISEADKILVKLSDKREFPAKLVGSDKGTDLALLKINAKDLPFVELGDSEKLKVGEWVVAIGSPFGFEYSSTAGIVSGKGRSIGKERYVPFIQTDVAINPGNSGGPLFDLEGKVIGINAQILSKSGGYLGLSFAIPVNVVRNVITQLKERGYVTRGWLGISFQEIDADLAKSFNLDRASGALVANIVIGSPAHNAGIKPGDIILKFNDEVVLNATQLPALVGNIEPGTEVDLLIFRQGKKQNMPLTIGELEPKNVIKPGSSNQDGDGVDETIEYNKLGLSVREMTDKERRGMDVVQGGVIIDAVKLGSIADNIGLSSGDVILNLNMQEVESNDNFNNLIESLPVGKWIPILIKGQSGFKRYFAFKITK